MTPRATYRLQLHRHFTFKDAEAIVPYLSGLGISHVYCSPYFRARPGSMHGYDIVDHNAFNPEIGTRDDFNSFVATLRAHQMGHIVDFVPNHVGIGSDNPWWMDVLENGRDSRFAAYFDIDWEVTGKLLLPVLGDAYGAVLQRGELRVVNDGAGGDGCQIGYHEHRFPISPSTRYRARTLGAAATADTEALHELLEAQHYRLAHWRVAADDINYRRFFDINELAALRMENAEVFEATHRLVFELIAAGQLDGLRIDHPDGLFDPREYFRRLRARAIPPAGRELYLVVEKITASFERLRSDWPVDGTTGYQFGNLANGVLVDARAKASLNRTYGRFIGSDPDWPESAYESKKLMLDTSLAAELNLLVRLLTRIAGGDRATRDFTAGNLRRALIEVIACFPVYRTYVTDSADDGDRHFVDWALAVARRRGSPAQTAVLDFLRAALLNQLPAAAPERRAQLQHFAMRFQQVTAPVTAKGVEDTALYRFHRLTSLNEVGGEPEIFGVSVGAFHAQSKRRARDWPREMLTTSTHDSKRSEDVRARIDVLTEVPGLWRQMLTRWSRMNRGRKRMIEGKWAPGPNQEYLLYQTLIGTWPLEPMDVQALAAYRDRIDAYMLKASREAKSRTSWSDISSDYESALSQFIASLLEHRSDNLFLGDMSALQQRLARFGCYNGLSQLLLKLTTPGMPDIYQGTELWDLSLVDPDNRRPVDYALRRRILDALREQKVSPAFARSLLDQIGDGRAKMHVVRSVLQFRREHPALFAAGAYLPARVIGTHAAHVCAFVRRSPDMATLIIVPRLYARLLDQNPLPPVGAVWGNTSVLLPQGVGAAQWRGLFDGAVIHTRELDGERQVPIGEALGNFPVAALAAA